LYQKIPERRERKAQKNGGAGKLNPAGRIKKGITFQVEEPIERIIVSRREIVLLVSRAIALLQIIAAVVAGVSSLPTQIFLFYRQSTIVAALPATSRMPRPILSAAPIFGMGLLTALLHIGLLLFTAALFWNCGPAIERMLSPNPEPSN
jgi:hypothetical protein